MDGNAHLCRIIADSRLPKFPEGTTRLTGSPALTAPQPTTFGHRPRHNKRPGEKASDIDGIGRRQFITLRQSLRRKILVIQDLLDTPEHRRKCPRSPPHGCCLLRRSASAASGRAYALFRKDEHRSRDVFEALQAAMPVSPEVAVRMAIFLSSFSFCTDAVSNGEATTGPCL